MRTQALLDFCVRIENTPASQWIQATPWTVPLVQTLHILALAALLAAAMMIDLRLLGLRGRDQPLARVAARFGPVIWYALPVLLASGLVMITGEPARALANAVFQLKMLLLLAAIVVTLGVALPLGRDAAFWDAAGRRMAARALALLSLLLWAGIVFAGRWIAYT